MQSFNTRSQVHAGKYSITQTRLPPRQIRPRGLFAQALAGAGGTARWYQQFLQAPATYLLQEAGENIERVVLVGPGAGEPPSEPEGEGDDLDPDGGIHWPLPERDRNMDRNKSDDADDPIDGFSKGRDGDLQSDQRVQSADSRQPLSYFGLWEFCFYNRPQDAKNLQTWWNDAEPVWRRFQQSSKDFSAYDSLIAGMKQTLTKNPHLPKSRFDANEVSLHGRYYHGCFNEPDDSKRFSRQIPLGKAGLLAGASSRRETFLAPGSLPPLASPLQCFQRSRIGRWLRPPPPGSRGRFGRSWTDTGERPSMLDRSRRIYI